MTHYQRRTSEFKSQNPGRKQRRSLLILETYCFNDEHPSSKGHPSSHSVDMQIRFTSTKQTYQRQHTVLS